MSDDLARNAVMEMASEWIKLRDRVERLEEEQASQERFFRRITRGLGEREEEHKARLEALERSIEVMSSGGRFNRDDSSFHKALKRITALERQVERLAATVPSEVLYPTTSDSITVPPQDPPKFEMSASEPPEGEEFDYGRAIREGARTGFTKPVRPPEGAGERDSKTVEISPSEGEYSLVYPNGPVFYIPAEIWHRMVRSDRAMEKLRAEGGTLYHVPAPETGEMRGYYYAEPDDDVPSIADDPADAILGEEREP